MAVMSTTHLAGEIDGEEWLQACTANDNQQFGRLLNQNAPDVLLLVGLSANCRQLLDTFRTSIPWGYAVALLDERELGRSGSLAEVDEVWPLEDRKHVHDRMRVLQRLAEQNRAWQALAPEVAAHAAYSNRLTLLAGQRLLSPARAAHQLLIPHDQVAAASVVSRRSLGQGYADVPLNVLGVKFPWGLVSKQGMSQVAEWPGGYGVSRAERSRYSATEAERLMAECVSLEYELQVERMQGVILKLETEHLSAQVSHHGKLAVAGELAAGIAHEIRNPLAAVRGFIQLLRQRLTKAQMATEIRYADYILDEIDRANQILNDFLAMTKPAKEQKRLVNLNELLTDLVQLVKHQAVLKGVNLIVDLDHEVVPIWAKSEALKQVFLNLFSNALQATPEGGTITLVSSLDSEQVRVDMHDTGEGIPPDQTQRIFEPFYTTKSGGTGLGLAICREILTEHGGTIVAKSVLGSGSTFSVCLPCSARWA